MSERTFPLLLFIASLASPASAERWEDFGQSSKMIVRLDRDSLKQDGSILSYRIEITHPAGHPSAGRRTLLTAQIDCTSGKRRLVETITIAANGTATTRRDQWPWTTMHPTMPGAGIRDRFCATPD